MRIRDLFEMPIRVNNLNVTDDDSVSSFHPDDRKLLNSPKALRKISDRWGKSRHDVDLYLLNVGHDPEKSLDIALDQNYPDDPEWNAILAQLDSHGLTFDPKAISVILTNNSGGARLPLTSWIIAHRLYHTFQSDSRSQYHQANSGSSSLTILTSKISTQLLAVLNDLTTMYRNDGIAMVTMAEMIGASRACREGNLNSTYELIPECFAQFILTGRVKLRPLGEEKFRHTGFSLDNCNKQVMAFERFLNREFETLLSMAQGRVVML